MKVKYFLLAIIFLFLPTVFAGANLTIPAYDMQSYDHEINAFYQKKLPANITDMQQRVAIASGYFLKRTYLLGALGEGPQGKFDQLPLYRTDAFDCTTYVATVLALAEAHNLAQFKTIIKKINYANGQVSYVTRNHFMSTDWNIANQRNGYLVDITAKLGAPVKVATAYIDKPNWYRMKTFSDIKLLTPASTQILQNLLTALHANANKVKPVIGKIDYLPLATLFTQQNNTVTPNMAIFNRIPSAAVIEIVHNNADFTKSIGTHLNVIHMGLAIRTAKGLMFRQASAHKDNVMDIPLIKYLSFFYRNHSDPQVIGINVQLIKENKLS